MSDDIRHYLVLDHGNTRLKATLFALSFFGSRDITARYEDTDTAGLLPWLTEALGESALAGAIYAASGHHDQSILNALDECYSIETLRMDRSLRLPIAIQYLSPETLGLDRIALACGAVSLGFGTMITPCIVADAGTALTLDVVYGSSFCGGDIAPGMSMRFEALHSHTARLPLVEAAGALPEHGEDTTTAIRCGVCRGMAAEVAMFAGRAAEANNSQEADLILTGGNAATLDTPVREALRLLPDRNIRVWSIPSLPAYGLLSILLYNHRL